MRIVQKSALGGSIVDSDVKSDAATARYIPSAYSRQHFSALALLVGSCSLLSVLYVEVEHILRHLTLGPQTDILRDGSAFSALQRSIPSREDLRISRQQEKAFNRVVRFLNLHEPTGHERDEEHKRDAIRYLGLRTMLTECSSIKVMLIGGTQHLKSRCGLTMCRFLMCALLAKTPNILEACVDKILQWFESMEESPGVSLSDCSSPDLHAHNVLVRMLGSR